MESTKKERRPGNFEVAEYVVKTQGYHVPDEKILELAKVMNMKPKVLLKNYKTISDIHMIFKGLMTWHQSIPGPGEG